MRARLAPAGRCANKYGCGGTQRTACIRICTYMYLYLYLYLYLHLHIYRICDFIRACDWTPTPTPPPSDLQRHLHATTACMRPKAAGYTGAVPAEGSSHPYTYTRYGGPLHCHGGQRNPPSGALLSMAAHRCGS